jgi:hypothetical protein
MKDLRKQPRLIEQIKAFSLGYFWLPCPICGEFFGGHEPMGSWYQGKGRGVCVCINCADEARKRSDYSDLDEIIL